jgi:hypothetical protein
MRERSVKFRREKEIWIHFTNQFAPLFSGRRAQRTVKRGVNLAAIVKTALGIEAVKSFGL